MFLKLRSWSEKILMPLLLEPQGFTEERRKHDSKKFPSLEASPPPLSHTIYLYPWCMISKGRRRKRDWLIRKSGQRIASLLNGLLAELFVLLSFILASLGYEENKESKILQYTYEFSFSQLQSFL